VAEVHGTHAISVIMEMVNRDDVYATASVMWENWESERSYTIHPNNELISLEYDCFTPCRLTKLNFSESPRNPDDYNVVSDLLGSEIMESFVDLRRYGMVAVRHTLTPINKLTMLETQIHAITTPRRLKKICDVMMAELVQDITESG